MDKPTFIHNGKHITDSDYLEWIDSIKRRLQQSQIKAAVQVNRALMEFNWSLGRDIVQMKAEQKWGSGVIKQLSLDLRAVFPNQTGFSLSNIKYIVRWYSFYDEGIAIGQQVVDQLEKQQQDVTERPMPDKFGFVPWGHHIEIISKCKTTEEALFYIDKTIEGNWSRRYLVDSIKSGLYRHQGSALTNFADKLPLPQSKLATEILKDPYNFDFLTMQKDYDEKQLEMALAKNVTHFLLELGKGFAYVGRQMELRMPNGKSFFPDMIFYHIRLRCYVVIELKVVDFIPEFAGKLNFYLTAADKLLRGEGDNPSIGLLICKSKDKTIVEWSFEGISKPLGVASYELQNVIEKTYAETLPSSNDIEKAVDDDCNEVK
jgi:predicted nuclease of restriction endonuclease-like (RecB) superfamily